MNPVAENGLLAAPPSSEMIRTDSVLVAEDDPISRNILKAWLHKWGFEVTVAEDGLQAWQAIQQENAPKLIILDWMMPGIDGIELCRRIRMQESAVYPYVLLLTAKDAKQDLINGLTAGADDYLTKPCNVNELRTRLNVGIRILRLQGALLRKEEELRFEASHDRLTSLWNRGAILDFLDREVARAQRSEGAIGVLMVDIDHFKSVNDTLGHLAGDQVLKQVAQRLPSAVRSYDWVGRYGGEEFLIIISNCSADTVAICAERLRAGVAGEPMHVDGKDLKITVSVGAAMAKSGYGTPFEDLLQIADEALYRAKKNGRNRVEFAWAQDVPAPNVDLPQNLPQHGLM
jgi:diguanylate cyclase (GGDEF)-like protein